MSQNKLYVGNLSFQVVEDDLRAAFEQYGTVTDVKVITDRDSGRSRGFGFAEMETEEEAKAAVAGLDGAQLDGRALKVNIARPRNDRGGSSNGGQRSSSRW